MKTTAVHVKDIIADLLKEKQVNPVSAEEQLIRSWEKIIPQAEDGYTRPLVIKNKVLLIIVSNSAWLHQLTLQKQGIIKRTREIIGEGIINDIRFKIGNPYAGAL